MKPDGSGTIEQTLLMNTAALKGMLGGLGGTQQSSGGINEDELRKAAARLGEGVTYVSSEPLKADDGFEGAKVIYAFTDINKVRVDQDPNLAGLHHGRRGHGRQDTNPVTFAIPARRRLEPDGHLQRQAGGRQGRRRRPRAGRPWTTRR